MRRPSITDVALLAGVSPATVSRSLRGYANVSPSTRQRVLDAASELSYVVSPHASGLASGQTHTVAVIVPFVTRWFFSNVVAGITDAFRDSAYDVMLYHLGSDTDRRRFFERMPLARRVDGVLSLSMALTPSDTLALRALEMPLVTVGAQVPGASAVRIDEIGAARTAVNHLVHQGHHRIAYIAGSQDDEDFAFTSSRRRAEGYRLAMREAGLPVSDELVVAGSYGVHGGAAAMAQLLSGSVLPTAIFAEYDEVGIGAMWALRRAGISVPGDISIVGIDDHDMAQVLDLTTIAQAVREQGFTAARLLLDALADPAAAPRDVVLPTRLILRGSTAPPAERATARSPAPTRASGLA